MRLVRLVNFGRESVIQRFIIFLLPILLYFSSLRFGFIWDDHTYILNNPIVTAAKGILQIWTTHASADFWPMSYSLFWLENQLFGIEAFGYHATNLVLFSLSALLLYELLKKLKLKSAYAIAVIFAVHPMNVESVVWVFQAKTNLANLFGLACLICWINFIQNNKKIFFYFCAIAFLVFSFLSKISMVMLPVIMFLYLYYLDSAKSLTNKVKITAPFFLISLVCGLTNIYWDANALPVPDSAIILESSLFFRFALVGHTFIFYLVKTFWPWPLMFAHPRWVLDLENILTFVPSGVLIVFLIAIGYKIVRKQKINVFLSGFIISFFILFPVLGLTEIYFMRFSFVAEHWLTLGMIGFLVPVVEFLYSKKYFSYFVWVFIFFLCTITLYYVQDYSSEKKLLETSLQKNAESILPHNILGLLYKNEDNFEKALFHFDRSIQIHPNAESYYNKASLFEKFGRIELAIDNYEKAIALNPYFANTYNNLAIIYAGQKNPKVALDYFDKALKIDPSDVRIYYNIGRVYENNNDFNLAAEWYKKAIVLQPSNALFLEALKRVNK